MGTGEKGRLMGGGCSEGRHTVSTDPLLSLFRLLTVACVRIHTRYLPAHKKPKRPRAFRRLLYFVRLTSPNSGWPRERLLKSLEVQITREVLSTIILHSGDRPAPA